MNQEKYKYKLFGRAKGRKKRKNYISYEYFLDKDTLDTNYNIDPHDYNILDIGSGNGENSIFLSINNPNSKIISMDIFDDGNINLHNEILNQKIKNILIYPDNALKFFDNIKIDTFIDEIWILFPDPWPKKRHNKRRLINTDFLKKVRYFLKKNANLFIATDSTEYLESIIINIYKLKDLYLWKNQDPLYWHYRYLNLPATKFSKKAEKSNIKPIFLQLKKI